MSKIYSAKEIEQAEALIVSSTILTLFVLPGLYRIFRSERRNDVDLESA